MYSNDRGLACVAVRGSGAPWGGAHLVLAALGLAPHALVAHLHELTEHRKPLLARRPQDRGVGHLPAVGQIFGPASQCSHQVLRPTADPQTGRVIPGTSELSIGRSVLNHCTLDDWPCTGDNPTQAKTLPFSLEEHGSARLPSTPPRPSQGRHMRMLQACAPRVGEPQLPHGGALSTGNKRCTLSSTPGSCGRSATARRRRVAHGGMAQNMTTSFTSRYCFASVLWRGPSCLTAASILLSPTSTTTESPSRVIESAARRRASVAERASSRRVARIIGPVVWMASTRLRLRCWASDRTSDRADATVSLIADQVGTKPNRRPSPTSKLAALNCTLEWRESAAGAETRGPLCARGAVRVNACTAAGDSSEIRARVFHVMGAEGRERGAETRFEVSRHEKEPGRSSPRRRSQPCFFRQAARGTATTQCGSSVQKQLIHPRPDISPRLRLPQVQEL
eukprot:scaffold48971_cov66-Phaeocystis_antarctica.AAC.4